MKNLSERLVWARLEKSKKDGFEMTQQALADKAGVSQSTIGNLESGLRRSARKLFAIAEALGVEPAWLSEGTGEPYKETVEFPSSANDGGTAASDLARIAAAYRDADKMGRKALVDAAETVQRRLKADRGSINNRQS